MMRTEAGRHHLQMALFSLSSSDMIDYEPPPAHPPPLPDEVVQAAALSRTEPNRSLLKLKELVIVLEIMFGEWRRGFASYIKEALNAPYKAVTISGVVVLLLGVIGLIFSPTVGIILTLAGALQLGIGQVLLPRSYSGRG